MALEKRLKTIASFIGILFVAGWVVLITLGSCVTIEREATWWLDVCTEKFSEVYSDESAEFCQFVFDEAKTEEGRATLCSFIGRTQTRIYDAIANGGGAENLDRISEMDFLAGYVGCL